LDKRDFGHDNYSTKEQDRCAKPHIKKEDQGEDLNINAIPSVARHIKQPSSLASRCG
jgi:hypothetical protein